MENLKIGVMDYWSVGKILGEYSGTITPLLHHSITPIIAHERLPDMFKRDIPEFLERDDISAESKKAILHDNPINFYGLKI